MSDLEPDLDFVRYADDIRQATSLKKFIESGKEKRKRGKERVFVELNTCVISGFK